MKGDGEMDATMTIQIAVARADIILCQVKALPWGRMGLSLLMAAIIIWVVKHQ